MKHVIVLFCSLLSVTASTAVNQNISSARSFIGSGDYMKAVKAILDVRDEVVGKVPIYRDHSLVPLAKQQATPSLVLNNLDQAEKYISAHDVPNAVRSLDLAYFSTVTMFTKTTPADRLTRAATDLHDEELSNNGQASPVALIRVARAAYLSGDYAQAIRYAQQGTAYPHAKQGAQFLHWEFIIVGLSQMALGNQKEAVNQLLASVNNLTGSIGDIRKFDLSLPKALVSRQPDAVIAYLESAALHPEWTERTKVPAWKQQILAGTIPDFGSATPPIY